MPIPLGLFRPAASELGDGSILGGAAPSFYSTKSLPITYSVRPQGSMALPVTYTVQQQGQIALPIYYLVGPGIATFAINGDISIPAPESMDYLHPTQIGLDLNLGVVVQGYMSVVWKWTAMTYEEIKTILAYYDPQHPQVTIVYPNEEGFWVSRDAMMLPPQIGQRASGEIYNGLTLTFSHIIPD